MILYLIIAVIFSIVSMILFEFFGPEIKETEDYIGICGLAVLCSILWPLELIIGLTIGAGLLTRRYKNKRKVK